MARRCVKAAWQRWRRIAEIIGNAQVYLLLSVFYFVIVLPFGLIVRLCSDPLQLRVAPDRSGWRVALRHEPSLLNARKQA